jgi:DNA polymerase III alpha subunit (gram-positive type)
MYIAFDTETTGVSKESNLLTAYFIILDEDLNIVDELDIRIKHDVYTVFTRALEVNKIDLLEHDKVAKTLLESRRELLIFLNKNKGDERYIPIGHNINFDIGFVKSSGLLKLSEYNMLINCNSIDTLCLCQYLKLCGEIDKDERLSLSNLCEYFKIDMNKNNLHNAEYDIKMTIGLLKKIRCIHEKTKSKKRKIN